MVSVAVLAGCLRYLFSTILRRVAYPVEPFDFEFIQDDLLPPVPGGRRNGSGKQPDLFDETDDCQGDLVQFVHHADSPKTSGGAWLVQLGICR